MYTSADRNNRIFGLFVCKLQNHATYICSYIHMYTRHGVIAISNRNRLQLITGFLVIAIVILVSKCHVIAIAIEYIAKVIAISDYFMNTTLRHRMWLVNGKEY